MYMWHVSPALPRLVADEALPLGLPTAWLGPGNDSLPEPMAGPVTMLGKGKGLLEPELLATLLLATGLVLCMYMFC